MAKEEGAKTVVLGGKNDVQQRYCGTVGGESTDFSTIDTQVKVSIFHKFDCACLSCGLINIKSLGQTTGLKNNSLAPPDL